VLLSSCSAPGGNPARAFKHAGDRVYVALGLSALFGHPCDRREGDTVTSVPVEECYRFLPPERMRGVWRDAFEGSEFFPGASRPPAEGAVSGIWLDAESREPLPPRLRRSPQSSGTRYLAIDFIGRRTRYPGKYGHMGASEHYVIVLRVLAAAPVS
jgi:hypothetical protein